MDRSPYLAQALAGMGAPQPQMAMPNLGAMADVAKARKAWEAINPGQSYARHQMGAMADGLRGVPGQLAQIPGNLTGLFSLGGGR